MKKACEEFGVEYQILPSFWAAFMSHLSYLKMMGQPSSAVNDESITKGDKESKKAA